MDNGVFIIDLIVCILILLLFVCVMVFCITFLICGIIEMVSYIYGKMTDTKTAYELFSENRELKKENEKLERILKGICRI